jgi:hypothetical protein
MAARADPWLAPGDLAVRHDIEVLADAGILRGPVTTWPISWPDVARDVLAETSVEGRAPEVEEALMRLQRAARAAARTGPSGLEITASGSGEPTDLRGFADVPRGEGELTAGTTWLGARFAAAARVTLVADPVDGEEVRLDGSYVGVTLGNFMISVAKMERWWGPGWDGSLILSNNARPMPALTVERNYTDASRWPVLRWFGPWRASLALARAEGSGVPVPDVRLFAARVNFKPRPWLEVGLSRTAQWCGEGRPCDFSTFLDLLIGRDNRSDSLSANDEPGNQMAGYDLRVRMPWKRWPTALYAQYIGEDEAGALPSKFLGLFGAEVSGGSTLGSWRVRAEFADTTCSFTRSQPQYDCAYRNSLYPQGYNFRGRAIGHELDGDGRMTSIAALLVRPSGTVLSVVARSVELNRDGAPDAAHTLSPAGASELDNIEIQVQASRLGGALTLGVGYDSVSRSATLDSGVRGFVRYSRDL